MALTQDAPGARIPAACAVPRMPRVAGGCEEHDRGSYQRLHTQALTLHRAGVLAT